MGNTRPGLEIIMSDVAEMLRKTLQSHKELYNQTQELGNLIGSLTEENKDLKKRLKLMEEKVDYWYQLYRES